MTFDLTRISKTYREACYSQRVLQDMPIYQLYKGTGENSRFTYSLYQGSGEQPNSSVAIYQEFVRTVVIEGCQISRLYRAIWTTWGANMSCIGFVRAVLYIGISMEFSAMKFI